MSNIINSQNFCGDNPVYEKKLSEGNISRYSEAPSVMPKYSIHNALKERDEFRKNVNQMHNTQTEIDNAKTGIGKFLALFAAIGGFLVLEAKKII